MSSRSNNKTGRPPNNELYYSCRTQQEVADMLGLTRQRVNQLEQQAFRKIRECGLMSVWEEYIRAKLVQ